MVLRYGERDSLFKDAWKRRWHRIRNVYKGITNEVISHIEQSLNKQNVPSLLMINKFLYCQCKYMLVMNGLILLSVTQSNLNSLCKAKCDTFKEALANCEFTFHITQVPPNKMLKLDKIVFLNQVIPRKKLSDEQTNQ